MAELNTTFNVTIPVIDMLQVAVNILYTTFGGIAAVGNLIIITLILSHKNLRRKELLILIGLAVGDTLYGSGFVIGGIRRLHLVTNNMQLNLVTPWFCQLQMTTFTWVFGAQLCSLMNIAISIDRLMAVIWIKVYLTLNIRYVLVITGIVSIVVTTSYAIGFILASTTMYSPPSVAIVCLSTQASTPSYGTYYNNVITGANSFAIIIYCIVVVVLKYRLKHTPQSALYDIQQKRQNKVTRTVALTTLLDFLMEVMPWYIQMALNAYKIPPSISTIVAPVFFLLSISKRIITVVVYMCKLRELREAFIKVFCFNVKKPKVSIGT